MKIKDRIKELRRVRASELVPHPKNWRVHPHFQQNALRAVLAEIGYASALLVRELPDGTLQLLDGHLRAETTPDAEVPVLILDLEEHEADKLLLTLDPLAAMAEANAEALDGLLRSVQTESQDLAAMFTNLAQEHGVLDAPTDGVEEKEDRGLEPPVGLEYRVIIECSGEQHQLALLERFEAEGLPCRALIS